MLHKSGQAMWSTNPDSEIWSSGDSVTTENLTLYGDQGCQRLLLLKAGCRGDVSKFEEIWLGTQALSLPSWSEEKMFSSVVVPDVERMDSPSSPLPPEDCLVHALACYSAITDHKERSSTKSGSLFNIDVDHTSETKSPGDTGPVDHLNADEIADNKNNQHSIGLDAWSLLQDFESLYQITSEPSTPETDHHQHPLALQDQPASSPPQQQEEFSPLADMEGDSPTDYLSCLEGEEVPLFADLDELDAMLCDAEAEDASDITTTTLDMAAVTALFTLGDYPDPDSLQPEVPAPQPPHTSDLLANLITGTILIDPSLEGLLSNTTLDFSSVFGGTVVTTICNTSQIELNDDVRSVESCSPASAVQEVPEIVLASVDGSAFSDNIPVCRSSARSSVKRRLSSSAASSCSEMDKSVVDRLAGTDEDSETPVAVKRSRKSSPKAVEDKFVEMRKKNNEASRRSRYARKQKFTQMELEMHQLEKRNKLLTGEADRLEKMVNTLKAAMFKQIQKA